MSSGGAGASSARASDEPPDPSAAWYRTKQQLEATPARQALLQKCGGDSEKARDKEAQYREKYEKKTAAEEEYYQQRYHGEEDAAAQ